MKQKDRGFKSSEVLGPGWGYFVDPDAFGDALDRIGKSKQISEVMKSFIYTGKLTYSEFCSVELVTHPLLRWSVRTPGSTLGFPLPV
jgi:hypothetical protein